MRSLRQNRAYAGWLAASLMGAGALVGLGGLASEPAVSAVGACKGRVFVSSGGSRLCLQSAPFVVGPSVKISPAFARLLSVKPPRGDELMRVFEWDRRLRARYPRILDSLVVGPTAVTPEKMARLYGELANAAGATGAPVPIGQPVAFHFGRQMLQQERPCQPLDTVAL